MASKTLKNCVNVKKVSRPKVIVVTVLEGSRPTKAFFHFQIAYNVAKNELIKFKTKT